jgi:ABC-type uncharacterized transport system auxiliary subunit
VNKSLVRLTLAVAAVAFLSGCAGKVRYPSYYTLSLPPAPDPPAQEGVHVSIAVREFRSPGYLRRGAIVYRTSPEQIGFYNYQRWAADPRGFVTDAVTDRLRASGKFAQVKPYDGHADVDYVLSGRLEKLEEVDYAGGVQVEVEIAAQMSSIATGEIVWTNDVREVSKVRQRDVASVVSAMSRTMDEAIGKLLAQVPNTAPSKSK